MQTTAMSGIGTLIIFIALILVAAVAAVVLIQTTTSLQDQAMATGKESKTQVSTQLLVVTVIADINKDTNRSIRTLRLTAKLVPGSRDIDLDNLILRATGGKGPQAFSMSGIHYAKSNGNSDTNCLEAIGANYGFPSGSQTDPQTWNDSSAYIDPNQHVGNVYSIKWNGNEPSDKNIIQTDQVVEICYNLNNQIVGKDQVAIDLIPTGGTPTQIILQTNPSFSKRYEQLFP